MHDWLKDGHAVLHACISEGEYGIIHGSLCRQDGEIDGYLRYEVGKLTLPVLVARKFPVRGTVFVEDMGEKRGHIAHPFLLC